MPTLRQHHSARLARPRIITYAYLFLVATVLSLASLPAHAALRKTTLQLHWQNQFEYAGYYAAIEQGYYKEEGLAVTIVEGGPGILPLTQMLEGNAEFCVGGSEMLLAKLRGYPIVALAAVFQHSAAALLVRSDSGIYTPQDLSGRIVEMGDLESDAEIHALLLNEGLKIDKITHVPSSFALDNIIGKKVDALSSYLSNQPYFLKKASIPYRIMRPLWYGIDFYGDALYTTEKVADQFPDVVEAFTRASLKGWTYALNHPDELIRIILAKYPPSLIPHTPEHLWYEYQEVKKLIMPTVIEIGHMNIGRFNHMAETFVQLGLAKPGYDLDHFAYDQQKRHINWHSWQIQGITLTITGLLLLCIITMLYRRRILKESALRSKAESAFQDSDQRMALVLSNTQSGYWEWNIEQDEIFFDNKATRLLGLSDISMQMSANEFEHSSNATLATLFNSLKGSIERDTARIELELQTSPLGTSTWLSVKGEITYDANHLSKRIAGTVTNVTSLKNCLKNLQENSLTNSQSSTPNHRLFFQKAEQMFTHARDQGMPIALGLLEVDQLKSIIEVYGYIAGDEILQDFSKIVQASIRPLDVLSRIGNEEFFILYPNTDKNQAKDMLTTLRGNVSRFNFTINEMHTEITFSAGVADSGELALSEFRPRALIARADKRLHSAKLSGKDKIIVN